jgi:predicted RNA-binding Zn ribbon-like protein
MYEPLKPETKELYLKIWTHSAVGNFTQEQLAKLFGCSQDTVANAINWAADNRTQFKASVLAEAAKEAVEAKLRELNNDLIRIKEKEPVNWNAAIGIEKLILENRQLLWKLQAVIQDKSIITVNNTTQVNQVLKARDEAMEGLNDAERQEIISRIREVADKQNNN